MTADESKDRQWQSQAKVSVKAQVLDILVRITQVAVEQRKRWVQHAGSEEMTKISTTPKTETEFTAPQAIQNAACTMPDYGNISSSNDFRALPEADPRH